MKLGIVIPFLTKTQKNPINCVTHVRISGDISCFSPKTSNFCYIGNTNKICMLISSEAAVQKRMKIYNKLTGEYPC